MKFNVVLAIFRRNFVNYFSNPTGYVFICVFVLLSSLAAFWPEEFFSANLANLNQLNRWLPYIMLIFIPAITMGIWAEERRLGTDELLLTIPAADFEVVAGKYLAAAAIYSCSLAFSGISNFAVLLWLGSPDIGLFFGVYFGYWMVGLTMLSIGMVASFLTTNVTVAFILGAAFNAPLVFAGAADVIIRWPTLAQTIKRCSVEAAFRDFGRGVISLSSLCYFVSITAVMLFLSVVLIGRRHWWGGRNGPALLGHYIARSLALGVIAMSLTVVFGQYDFRADVTEEQLTALSPKTKQLLRQLDPPHPIVVEAFISPDVPDLYVQTRLDLLNVLQEIKSRGGVKVEVRIHETELFSDAAKLAEEQYDISSRAVASRGGGSRTTKEIYLGVAILSGLDKIIIPFLDRGMPVEYELIRSIVTMDRRIRVTRIEKDSPAQKAGFQQDDVILEIAGKKVRTPYHVRSKLDESRGEKISFSLLRDGQSTTLEIEIPAKSSSDDETEKPVLEELGLAVSNDRLKVGVLQTSAGISPNDTAGIIGELRKQYDVEAVDPSSPIEKQYDVVLAVQPSTLSEAQMTNFINMIRQGQPTAVFEDPLPYYEYQLAGTSQDSRPPQMRRFGMAPRKKIVDLWSLLGIRFGGDEVVYDEYNPHQVLQGLPKEFVFVGKGSGARPPFREDHEISKGLQELVFLCPGWISRITGSAEQKETGPSYTPLVNTGLQSGVLPQDRVMVQQHPQLAMMMGGPQPHRFDPRRNLDYKPPNPRHEYSLAVHIRGKLKKSADTPFNLDDFLGKDKEKTEDVASEANVVVVADVDCLHTAFVNMRAAGDNPDEGVNMRFDNVTFVLNILDHLAGDDRFIEIRGRRRVHRTLTRVEKTSAKAMDSTAKERKDFEDKFKNAESNARAEFDKKLDKIRERTDLTEDEKRQVYEITQEQDQEALRKLVEKERDKRDSAIRKIEIAEGQEKRRVQHRYKLVAVILPPILPLLMGIVMFFNRRAKEREGVPRQRLRHAENRG